jgi:CRISPR-associated protein Cmr2
MTKSRHWKHKLAARLHDPAEKALVLMRDPAGHENGTSQALRRLLGLNTELSETLAPDSGDSLSTLGFKSGLPLSVYRVIQRADWWASAADRPQWPMQEITVNTKRGQTRNLKVADWAQVRWAKNPVLIHPLTAKQFDLKQHGDLSGSDISDLKQRSFTHFAHLAAAADEGTETEKDMRTLLAFWRFGPELREEQDNDTLGALWSMLPADTRVPDHSIWDHLDLTSAFAGAFSADPNGEAALLTLAIGPVQPFIAAARSTSDLWAGSHLLARLAWEAMKPVCEQLGPDAILFPRLRGVPQVDLWLRDECGLPEDLFEMCDWNKKGGTDSNPLFSAALPNRFVAVVPRNQAEELARTVEREVRQWLQDKGQEVVDRLLATADLDNGEEQHCHRQMREQLEGFPEVHWAIVPFSLIQPRNKAKQTDLDTVALSEAMAPFFGVEPGQPCGFLTEPAWRTLQQAEQATWDDNTTFFRPNPGVLYPAIHDLAERVLAASKSVRPFAQSKQTGWRCSLSGETEWLTTDPDQLKRSYRQQDDTLWAKVAKRKPAWAKKGEHLGALPAIKRLWPTLFAEEVGKALGQKSLNRFVVSTHTMALAHQLDQWLEQGGLTAEGLADKLHQHKNAINEAALPRKLMRRHAAQAEALTDAKKLPALLEYAADENLDETERRNLRKLVERTLRSDKESDKETRLETYYSLLLMDGDRMGAWLAGGDDYAISYRESFHPDVQKGFEQRAKKNPAIRAYGEQKRAISPGRHMAISAALNDFSLHVVRHVVEEEHFGRLIYAGGDDVLAMLPVIDLLPAMQRLRHAYSGHDPDHPGGAEGDLTLQHGFALLKGRLMRMMGDKASASCGAVIAHHQAPLAAVRRELTAAEQRAKNDGGRDAFSLAIIKRSGGALRLTADWGEPVKLLTDLRDWLRKREVSRRAVYHTLEWLDEHQLPDLGDGELLRTLLTYQLARQAEKTVKAPVPAIARRLVELTLQRENDPIPWLRNFLSVAEFLARETRSGGDQ